MATLSRRAILWVLFAGLLFAPRGASAVPSASPPSIDDKVTVRLTSPVLNRATATFDMYATIINSSQSTFDGPMLFVVTGATPAGVTLANASGTTPDGLPFVNVPIESRGFTPGRAMTVLLKFTNPSLARFTISRSVRAVRRGAPAVVAIDPNPATIALGGSQQLTVRIQNPSATQVTRVTLSTGAPQAIVSVPSTVTVPAGRTSARVTVAGRAVGGPVNVIATLGGSSATTSVSVLQRPPAPVVFGPLNAGAIRVTGSGISGASVTVLVNGHQAGTGVVNGDKQFDIAVVPLASGDVVRALQTVGGLQSAASVAVTVAVLPPTPIIDLPLVAGMTSVTGVAEPGGHVSLAIDGTPGPSAVGGPTGRFTIVVPALVVNARVTATQTDGGSASAASAPALVVGTPPPPVITAPVVAGSGVVSGTAILGASITLSIDGVTVGNAVASAAADGPGARWSITTAPLIDGSHVSAVQTLGTAASATADAIVVSPPPPPEVLGPLVGGATTIAGRAASGAIVEVFVNGGSRGTTTADAAGDWSLFASLSIGQSVQTSQTVGGAVSSLSEAMIVVSQPPPPFVDAPVVAGSTSVSGSASVGATVDVFVNGVNEGLAAVAPDGTWRLALDHPLVAGDLVRALQQVGGVSSVQSSPVAVVTPPQAPVVDAPLVAGDTVVRGTGIPDASVRVFRDGVAMGSTAVGIDSEWAQPSAPPLATGQVITATQTVAGVESPLSAPVTVGAVALRRIDITPSTTVTIAKGRTQSFTARGTFSDGSMQSPLPGVTWSSDASGVATVNSAGVATGVGVGPAHIRASRDGLQSAATTLDVTAPVIVSLAVNPQGPTLIVGSTLQLQAIATLSDGTTPDVTTVVTWSSDHANFASVSVSGLVTAVAVGSATITATHPSGATATTLVTVNPVPITGPPPTLASVSPARGTSLGGTLLTLTGTNFTAQMSVTVGGATPTEINVVNQSMMTVRAPVGAVGAVADIAISNNNGSASLSAAYTYLFPFGIPAAIPVATGTTGTLRVTLIEPAFTTTSVNIANDNASVATLPSSTSVAAGQGSVDVPITPVSAGTSNVTVTVGGSNLVTGVLVAAAYATTCTSNPTADHACSPDFFVSAVGVLVPPTGPANASAATTLASAVGVEVIPEPLATLPLTGTTSRGVTLPLGVSPSASCSVTSSNTGAATASSCVVNGDGSVTFTVASVATGEAVVTISAGGQVKQIDVLVNQSIAAKNEVLAATVGVFVPPTGPANASAATTLASPVGIEVLSEPLATLLLTRTTTDVNHDVTLPLATPAPGGGLCVAVTSSNASVATVPSGCINAVAGAINFTFTVTGVGTGESIVTVTAGTAVQQIDVRVNGVTPVKAETLALPVAVFVPPFGSSDNITTLAPDVGVCVADSSKGITCP